MKPDISSNATFAAVVHNELEEEKKVQFRVGCRYLPQTNFRFSQPSRGRPDRADRGEAHLNDVRFNSN